MRDLLGRYLERPAEMLALSLQPGGKPFLDLPIKFNLSHCADTALLAVTPTAEVGVDVERLREVGDPLRLAGRALTADELAQLSDAPSDRQLELFLDLWTRMEARQKAFGRGIFAARIDPARCTSPASPYACRIPRCRCASSTMPDRESPTARGYHRRLVNRTTSTTKEPA